MFASLLPSAAAVSVDFGTVELWSCISFISSWKAAGRELVISFMCIKGMSQAGMGVFLLLLLVPAGIALLHEMS